MKLKDLAARIGGAAIGDGETEILRLNTIEAAGPGDLTFIANPKYAARLDASRASAVIVKAVPAGQSRNFLVHDDPYYAVALALKLLCPAPGAQIQPGIAASARVDASAQIGSGVHIGEFVEIGADTRIGDGSRIMTGCVVGRNCRIGNDSQLYPHVVVYDECLIGSRVAIHAGTVVGSDGFGYATHAGVHHKVYQIGRVRIEDDVEIGANCTIDRGALNETVIGSGSKIDNLVQIAHNVRIGRGCIIVAQVGIAGSTVLGDYVVLGGQVGLVGHLEIGSGTRVSAQSGVTKSYSGGDYGGTPARPMREYREIEAHVHRLPQRMDELKRLKSEVEELRKQLAEMRRP